MSSVPAHSSSNASVIPSKTRSSSSKQLVLKKSESLPTKSQGSQEGVGKTLSLPIEYTSQYISLADINPSLRHNESYNTFPKSDSQADLTLPRGSSSSNLANKDTTQPSSPKTQPQL